LHDSRHMTPDEFRSCGHALVDWIARYYETIEDRPVLAQIAPGQIRSQLPGHAPEEGEPFERMLQDVEKIIMPGVTHWQSPNFFAFFPANTSFPSILGDLLSAGLGVQGMLWATSPASTELETHVMDWVAEMVALPPMFHSRSSGGGVIQDSASSAVLCAILAARERKSKLLTNEKGCDGTFVAYASTQAHSSVEKAIKIAGIGRQNLCLIDVDESFAMRPEVLKEKIASDRQAGKIPFFVSGTIGTTSSNAMDPLAAIGQIAREEGLWFHVDGAMAGTAAVCPEFRRFQAGLEYADSYAFNPHKWMFTNFDCSCFFVANRADLINSLSILPEYLRNKATESGAVIDYRDWQISLGRRFRSLKLWFVIRHYGIQGLQLHIRRHVELAQQLAANIKADPRFELTIEPPLNLVCFRVKGGDEINQKLMDRLNQSGKLYFTHTKLADKMVLRMCIGQTHTDQIHVDKAWQLIQTTTKQLLS
jgi:aromatic-L-amino-acid/L-tryptophan decarboxylase